ncbi:hypothetical protein ONE63_003967 [Megalurothrips usitatus]|uniref:Kinesin-like protein n=1 Tax=Megalurothrips usitatus TaxID=439358 RepID=A0AAV7X4P0_9NEOP|nr:hypothetical protein ONE63_003967 [Megalurothrips usitatus]
MGPIGPMGDGGSGEAVQVVVRCRPMSRKEAAQGHTPIIDMWPQRGIVHITNPRRPGGPWRSGSARMFTFDSVYDWDSSQDDLYENTVRPLVFSVLDGYNGTIFAYGQTGTGKTYTMLGSQEQGQQQQASRERGIASKCFEDVFRHIGYTSDHTSYVVRASYLEIYQEETRDLLAADEGRRPPALPLGEDAARGVYVKGLRSVVCKNIKAIERVMRTGNLNRATAATNMNEHSSRSHAIFQVTVEMKVRPGVRVGKLNLVDLAGSERQCKTGAVGDRLKESGKINLSLSALGNVISALTAADGGGRAGGNRHIPYRDSKLTQLLQDSLGGNAKAIMIANIGPASYNYDESLMTLRYASRAKHIKNRPTRNVNALAPRGPRPTPRPAPRPAPRSALTHYNEEMRALQDLILVEGGGGAAGAGGGRGDAGPTTSSSSSTDSSGGGGGDRGGRRRHHPRLGRSPRARSIRRHHRRGVWRLHGKRHQETTVQMVRWIQDQMGARGDRCVCVCACVCPGSSTDGLPLPSPAAAVRPRRRSQPPPPRPPQPPPPTRAAWRGRRSPCRSWPTICPRTSPTPSARRACCCPSRGWRTTATARRSWWGPSSNTTNSVFFSFQFIFSSF